MKESSKDSCEAGTINPILQLGKQKQKGSWIFPKPQRAVASIPHLAFSELAPRLFLVDGFLKSQRAALL